MRDFSLRLLPAPFERSYSALDRRGVWGFLSDVRARDERTVDFHFQRVFVPGFDEIAAQQIVPEHAWRDVADPVSYPNENPIATGPFTEVRVFRNQIFELGRNPLRAKGAQLASGSRVQAIGDQRPDDRDAMFL